MQVKLGMSYLKRYRSDYSRFTRNIVTLLFVTLVLFVFVPSSTAAPNPPSIEWRKTYEGLQANSIIQTSDGGYAIAGAALSLGETTLVKTDSSGNVQWQKALGDAVSLAQTSDSGYVLFCENGDVVKTDPEGNVLSSFSLRANGGVRQGIITNDGTYIVVGNSIREGQENYVWLHKVDAQGNIIWDMNFTGGFHVSAVVNTVDRGCALAGNWKNNFWLARLDSNGNQQWSQNYVYGNPLDAHLVYSMAKTKDGGFILAGTGMWQSSNGMIPWLIKINAQGYEQWNLPYGQYPSDSFSTVVQTADQGYLVARPRTALIMRADSSGSELGQEQLGTSAIRSPSGYPASCLILSKDGGYVIAGSTSGSAFIIKFSSEADFQAPVVRISNPQSKTYDTSDVPLTFTVNDQTSLFSYTLDGQQAVAITGNITLTGLAVGAHNLTVYARDSEGLVETSETISFTVGARFPSEIVFVGLAIAVVASVCFLLYVKRRSLSDYRKSGIKSLMKKQNLAAITQNKMVWTLIIISLCFVLVFVQFFFPYVFYSSSSIRSNGSFEVGVSYVYERDNVEQIYSEVSHIKDLGFKVIRVNLVCDSNIPSSYLNTLSDVFFSAIRQLGMKVALIINDHSSPSEINYYLYRWGKDIAYIQILNEPDVASSWNMGALFTDDEAGSKFEEIYSIVEQHHLPAQRYTNFSPAFIARTNLPIQFSEKLDFIGFDVFMDSFLTLSPNMIQFLQKITNKDLVIAEFGMSTNNDATQSDYIIKGLNLFRNMGLKGCWLVYWNSADNDYGIRGRLTEQKVGEWIAQNA
jgi:hypothetical protein